jgi:hypothetical protein
MSLITDVSFITVSALTSNPRAVALIPAPSTAHLIMAFFCYYKINISLKATFQYFVVIFNLC